MLLTKLLTRSRLRGGDALGSISGLERFEWFRFRLNPDLLEDGDRKWDGGGEENVEGVFFTMSFTESRLSRLRRGEVSWAWSSEPWEGERGEDGGEERRA